MSVLLTAALLLGAVLIYGKKWRWSALLLFLVYLVWSTFLAHELIHGASPAAFWTVAALGAGAPLAFLTVVVADARLGLFSLDTFLGIIFIVALSPVLLAANTVALVWRAFPS